MIEAFDEVVKDEVMVDELKTWLLKQTNTKLAYHKRHDRGLLCFARNWR
ncbi:MAG: hypothetical protein IPN09_14275 [Bacteroidetes bacterium]|nr:hypothetical protein [Bacteroidota bacterium]